MAAMKRVGDYVMARRAGLAVAFCALLLDTASKHYILLAAARGALPHPVMEGWLELVLAFNRGMSFSLLSGHALAPWILGLTAVVACGWFFHWLGVREKNSSWWLHTLGLGLLMGGAMGNLLDRITHGMVVDMLKVTLAGWPVPFVFNLADAAISVGVALLLWDAMGQEILRVYARVMGYVTKEKK